MNRRSILIGAGGAAFIVALAAELPASAALRWLAPPGLRASGVAGTVWSGSATGAEIGAVRLGETQWTLFLPAAFIGRASGTVATHIGDATFNGSVSWSASGNFSCEGCVYEGSLASLRPLIPALRGLQGTARIEMAELEVREKWPTRLIGTAKLADVPLAVPGAQAGPKPPTAGFEADISADPVADGGVIEATIHDSGGPLEMTARLTMSPPGNYELAGRAKARPEATPDIVNALNLLGPKGSDGSTEISMAGTF